MTYSPSLSGPAGTGIGNQTAKSDWQAIAVVSVLTGLLFIGLVCTGLYLGERHLAEAAIYTA